MIKLTERQKEASELFRNYREVLLEGGSRSGKTLLICSKMLVRAAKYPGTRHLSVRLRFNHAKQSLFYGTYRDAAKILGVKVVENKSDWFLQVPTKGDPSEIWIGGLDDKERTEKILGNEYATEHINEGSQISYDGYEIVKTRLNPPKGVPALLMVDYNPPSTKHWGHKVFHEGIDPVTGQPLKDANRRAWLRMNPTDNLQNLSEGYIEQLEGMSEAKRRRFLLGEYTDGAEGAIWEWDWIMKNRVSEVPDLLRLEIGVDPAVTGTDRSDSTGIIIAGQGADGHFYVTGDHTYRGGVTGWGQEVAALYSRYHADGVVAEVNQGGDLVVNNIRQYNRAIPVRVVRATRGKAIRAEPIADLYRRGMVHHVGEFPELEHQLTHWTPEDKESPDALDALVWVITHLAQRTAVGRLTFSRG